MPDDHSKVAPLLPIPNRTVKRLCADDSADSRVKVGHRQALIPSDPHAPSGGGGFSSQAPWARLARRFFRVACKSPGFCAIMRGSADRGGARKEGQAACAACSSDWIINKIQPISVGV